MAEVSTFDIQDLQSELAGLHMKGITCVNNPYAQLAEHRLDAIITCLQPTPHNLAITTGSSKADGLQVPDLTQQAQHAIIPPNSIIELRRTFPLKNLITDSLPILYAGSTKYLSIFALSKTLTQNGQLHLRAKQWHA